MERMLLQMQRIMHKQIKSQQASEAKRRAEASKQNHWTCMVYKNLPVYDHTDGKTTITEWLQTIIYVLKGQIKGDYWKTTIIAKLSHTIYTEI